MQQTPFDVHAALVNQRGYHNHRVNTHSDVISDGILQDLWRGCPALRADLEAGRVGFWKNKKIKWGRGRDTDLIIAEPIVAKSRGMQGALTYDWHGAAVDARSKPNPNRVRIMIEHKSVITAHRNRDARYDDLNNLVQDIVRDAAANIVIGATVMVGVSEYYLNIPDKLLPNFIKKSETGKKQFDEERFSREILARVKAHDEILFKDYSFAVSYNKSDEIKETFGKFNRLSRRPQNNRSQLGYDALLLCPVYYDNVHEARVARNNDFGIDVDGEYQQFLRRICEDYTALWGRSE
jgi:hypothetical protein